jgi:cbb3-type cytochrome oxidase subunit 3
MNVLLLTMFVSLLLVVFFALAFWWSSRRHEANPERDSLLPLADETPVLASKIRPTQHKRS